MCGHYYYSLYVVHILLHTKADSRGSINLFTIYLWFACNVCHLAYIHVLNSGNYKMCFRWLSCRVCVLCAFCVCVCAGDKRVYRQLLAKRHKLVSYWVRHTFSRCLAKKNSSILFFFNFQFNIRKLANITKCIHMKCVYV